MFFKYDKDPGLLAPLTLAYIGDAVYELYVRTSLLAHGEVKVHTLHKDAVKRVNASTQAKLLERIDSLLTAEELAIVKRGRNAKSGQIPKNADVIEYRKSTGLEALIGYLFLQGELERIKELLAQIEKFMEDEHPPEQLT